MATIFTISGQHIEVSPALDSYIRKKLSKVERMFDNVTHINVTITVQKYMQNAEAEVRLAGDQNTIFAKATSDDMYKSIDELEHKILAQVKKYHDKLIDRKEDRT